MALERGNQRQLNTTDLEGMVISRVLSETLLVATLRSVAAGALPRLDIVRELNNGRRLLLENPDTRGSVMVWAERRGISADGVLSGYEHFARNSERLIDQFSGSERQGPTNG